MPMAYDTMESFLEKNIEGGFKPRDLTKTSQGFTFVNRSSMSVYTYFYNVKM